jgi:hypothetical protein
MQLPEIEAFFDELEKIGARKQSAGFMQSRSGIRPYRVDTLLNRTSESPMSSSADTTEPLQDAPEPEAEQHTAEVAGEEDMGKTAEEEKTIEKAIGGFASARPYVAGGIAAGGPAAFITKTLMGEHPKATRAAQIAGAAGLGIGAANVALKRWAEKHKNRNLSKKILAPAPGTSMEPGAM